MKASGDDLAWLAPGADTVDAARGLIGHDGAVALVTLGADGALVVTPDEVRELASPAVEVVDTIGAGDAFMGGFLACWRRNGLGREDVATRPGRRRGGVRVRGRGAHLLARGGRSAPLARSALRRQPSTTLKQV